MTLTTDEDYQVWQVRQSFARIADTSSERFLSFPEDYESEYILAALGKQLSTRHIKLTSASALHNAQRAASIEAFTLEGPLPMPKSLLTSRDANGRLLYTNHHNGSSLSNAASATSSGNGLQSAAAAATLERRRASLTEPQRERGKDTKEGKTTDNNDHLLSVNTGIYVDTASRETLTSAGDRPTDDANMQRKLAQKSLGHTSSGSGSGSGSINGGEEPTKLTVKNPNFTDDERQKLVFSNIASTSIMANKPTLGMDMGGSVISQEFEDLDDDEEYGEEDDDDEDLDDNVTGSKEIGSKGDINAAGGNTRPEGRVSVPKSTAGGNDGGEGSQKNPAIGGAARRRKHSKNIRLSNEALDTVKLGGQTPTEIPEETRHGYTEDGEYVEDDYHNVFEEVVKEKEEEEKERAINQKNIVGSSNKTNKPSTSTTTTTTTTTTSTTTTKTLLASQTTVTKLAAPLKPNLSPLASSENILVGDDNNINTVIVLPQLTSAELTALPSDKRTEYLQRQQIQLQQQQAQIQRQQQLLQKQIEDSRKEQLRQAQQVKKGTNGSGLKSEILGSKQKNASMGAASLSTKEIVKDEIDLKAERINNQSTLVIKKQPIELLKKNLNSGAGAGASAAAKSKAGPTSAGAQSTVNNENNTSGLQFFPEGPSILSNLLVTQTDSDNPLKKYSRMAGKKGPTSITLSMYLPWSSNPKTPLKINVLGEATVEDVIGYTLYMYNSEKLLPILPEDLWNVQLFSIRIVEDFEIDDDFPALERMRSIKKFSFDSFALCEIEANIVQKTVERTLASAASNPVGGSNNNANGSANTSFKSSNIISPATNPAEAEALSNGRMSTIDGRMSQYGSVMTSPIAKSSVTSSPSVPKPNQGANVFLKVHLYSTIEVKQTTTFLAQSQQKMSEVFENICKKHKYDSSKYAMKMPDIKSDVPMDVTLESLKITEFCILKKSGGGAGDIFLRPTDEIEEDTATMREQGMMIEPDEYTSMYRQYQVTQKSFMRQQTKQLTIDGDYIHILSGQDSKNFFDANKTQSFHASSVASCQAIKQGHQFRLTIIGTKSGEDKLKAYDFEAASAAEATEICTRITVLVQMNKRAVA